MTDDASQRTEADGRLKPQLRAFLVVAAVLVFVAGISLYVFASRTDEWFAWKLAPPISAAFLGAMFWSTLASLILAVRINRWEVARASVPATLAFATPLLAATLMHLDLFNFDSPHISARFAAWLWAAVYVVVPPALAWIAWRHDRTSRLPSAEAPITTGIRVGLGVVALVGLGVGSVVFIAPVWAGEWWPWSLTALAGRAVASGFLGLGVGSAYGVFHGDLRRGLLAFPSYTALGVLQLAAVVRFGGDVDWSRPASTFYIAFFLLVGTLGVMATGPALASTSGHSPSRQPSATSPS